MGDVFRYLELRAQGLTNKSEFTRCKNVVNNLLDDIAAKPGLNVPCEFSGEPRATFLVDFSPNMQRVASTHGDHTVRVTDIKTGKCTHILTGHPRTPWCLAFHPTSNDILASGCLAGDIRIWDLLGGGSEKLHNPSSGQVITSLAFHPLAQVLAFSTLNYIYFWDWSEPAPFACTHTAHENERIRWLRFDPFGQYLYTGIANNTTLRRDGEQPLDVEDRYPQYPPGRTGDDPYTLSGLSYRPGPVGSRRGLSPRPRSPVYDDRLESARHYAYLTNLSLSLENRIQSSSTRQASHDSNRRSQTTSSSFSTSNGEDFIPLNLSNNQPERRWGRYEPLFFDQLSRSSRFRLPFDGRLTTPGFHATDSSAGVNLADHQMSRQRNNRPSETSGSSAASSSSHPIPSRPNDNAASESLDSNEFEILPVDQERATALRGSTRSGTSSSAAVTGDNLVSSWDELQELLSRMPTRSSDASSASGGASAIAGVSSSAALSSFSAASTAEGNESHSLAPRPQANPSHASENNSARTIELPFDYSARTITVHTPAPSSTTSRFHVNINEGYNRQRQRSLDLSDRSDFRRTLSLLDRLPRPVIDQTSQTLGAMSLPASSDQCTDVTGLSDHPLASSRCSDANSRVSRTAETGRMAFQSEEGSNDIDQLRRKRKLSKKTMNDTTCGDFNFKKMKETSGNMEANQGSEIKTQSNDKVLDIDLQGMDIGDGGDFIPLQGKGKASLKHYQLNLPFKKLAEKRKLSMPPTSDSGRAYLAFDNKVNNKEHPSVDHIALVGPDTSTSTAHSVTDTDVQMSALDLTLAVTSPLISQSPVASPLISQSPVASPLISQSPVASPLISQSPVASPLISQSSVVSPLISQSPVSTPLISQSPVSTPLISQSPVSTPLISQSPVSTPLISQSPIMSPLISQSHVLTPLAISPNLQNPCDHESNPHQTDLCEFLDPHCDNILATSLNSGPHPKAVPTSAAESSPLHRTSSQETDPNEFLDPSLTTPPRRPPSVIPHAPRQKPTTSQHTDSSQSKGDSLPSSGSQPKSAFSSVQPSTSGDVRSSFLNPASANPTGSSMHPINLSVTNQRGRWSNPITSSAAAHTPVPDEQGSLQHTMRQLWEVHSGVRLLNEMVPESLSSFRSSNITQYLERRVVELDRRISELENNYNVHFNRIRQQYFGGDADPPTNREETNRSSTGSGASRDSASLGCPVVVLDRLSTREATGRHPHSRETASSSLLLNDPPSPRLYHLFSRIMPGAPTTSRASFPTAFDASHNLPQPSFRYEDVPGEDASRNRSSTRGQGPPFLYNPHYMMYYPNFGMQRIAGSGLGAAFPASGIFFGREGQSSTTSVAPQTHRIQRWNVTKCVVPDITDASANVVVNHCKLHNDASCDLSKDGTLLATFVTSPSGLGDKNILVVYSLSNDTFGQCLYSKHLSSNALSVSISPMKQHVLVGTAAKRFFFSTASCAVAQVYRLQKTDSNLLNRSCLDLSKFSQIDTFGASGTLKHVKDVFHPTTEEYRYMVSANSARWLPRVGDGLVYGTNKGDLHFCRPGSRKVADDTPTPRDVCRLLGHSVSLLNAGTQTTTGSIRRHTSTQTLDDSHMEEDS